MSPVPPGPGAAVLDLGAVSDYVPALEYGPLPDLEYGPLPDSDAARNYGLALDYDALHGPPSAAARDPVRAASITVAPEPVAAPDPALARDPVSAPEPVAAPDPALARDPVPASDPVSASDPATAPDPAPAPAARVSAATYWRRRTVAIAVGIAVLTILAWTLSGTLGGAATGRLTGHGGRPSAGTHRHAGRSRAGQRRPARKGSPQSLPGHAASNVHSTRAEARQSGQRELPGISSVLAVPVTGHLPAAGVADCARGDVVLSLVSPRQEYQQGEWPQFGVAAVSTGNRPCRFNMGSRFATVVVTSGRARVWGSADCVRGPGSQIVVLSRGVPVVRWVAWDRAPTSPGCRYQGRPARQGAFTAIAFDGELSSQVMVFVLGRPGVAVP